MEPRVKGHRRRVGGAYAYHEKKTRGGVAGSMVCECGAYSPVLPSEYDRDEWHRRHIADVIAGKTALL